MIGVRDCVPRPVGNAIIADCLDPRKRVIRAEQETVGRLCQTPERSPKRPTTGRPKQGDRDWKAGNILARLQTNHKLYSHNEGAPNEI
jgi:hypothetical protein